MLLLQSEQTHLSQLLLLYHVLQSLGQFSGSALDSAQHLSASLTLRRSNLDTVLLMQVFTAQLDTFTARAHH